METLGFTKKSIHEYFHEALSTQLSSTKLEDECRKLRDHLANYPAIESSCYIPLNASIIALLYLQRNQSLPTTHFEILYELLLLCIAREVNTRQPERNLTTISSLDDDDLPFDLKKQLEQISILAYEGVINNKIVFTQNEVLSISPKSIWGKIFSYILPAAPAPAPCTPGRQDLPAMGVLQRVQWAGTSSNVISYNFVHLSIQEMLAAYRISKMGYAQQVRVFQTLLSKPRFASVLQFYAGFTKLTNRGVRSIITGRDFIFEEKSQLSLLSYIRCFFEAQIRDQSLYEKIIPRLNGKLYLSTVTLSPLDCMSVGYFLAFVLRNSRELSEVYLPCINDHSIHLMMRELSKHGEADALHGVIKLQMEISGESIGIAHIATALQTNTTMRTLNISHSSISDEGAESLARALAVNRSLQELFIVSHNIGDSVVQNIATILQANNTLKLLRVGGIMTTDKGVLSLAAALTSKCSGELGLFWLSFHPENTLKRIGECVRKSTLGKLYLSLHMPCMHHCLIVS